MVCYDMCKSRSVCISWYSCWWLYCTTQKKILKMRRIFILYKNKLEIELEVDIESKLEMRQVRAEEGRGEIGRYSYLYGYCGLIFIYFFIKAGYGEGSIGS